MIRQSVGAAATFAVGFAALVGAAACFPDFDKVQGGCKDCGSPDAALRRFCEKPLVAGEARFCDDFDGRPIAEVWSSETRTGSSVLATDTADAESPPRALRARAAAGELAFVAASNLPSESKRWLHVSFSLRIDSGTETGGVLALRPEGPGGRSLKLMLAADASRWHLDEVWPKDGGGAMLAASHFVNVALPTSAWVRVDVALDVIDPKCTLRYGSARWDFDLETPFRAPSPRFELGLMSVSDGGAWDVHVDDVTYFFSDEN